MLDKIRELREWADALEQLWVDGAARLGLTVHGLTQPRPPTPTPVPPTTKPPVYTPPAASPDPDKPYTGPSDEEMWEEDEEPTPPTPLPTALPIVGDVHTTCWGNEADEKAGHWSAFAYPWSPKIGPFSGKTTVGAAVPFKVLRGDVVRVRYGDKWTTIPVIDKGPWNTNDPYLLTGARPAAESGTDTRGRKTNKAGLDLTPLAWALITGRTAGDCWKNPPDAKLDVQLIRFAPGAPGGLPSQIPARIRAAALALPDPFPYHDDTEDGNLGCANVVSHALIEAGVIDHVELSVNGLVALLKKLGWVSVNTPYKDGDVVEWDKRPGGKHKHIGILILEGGQVMTVQNSSTQRKVIRTPLATYDRPLIAVLRAPGGQHA